MPTPADIRRVIVVVLDGLRPDAIDAFGLTHIRALAHGGASTMCARTVSPSCTWPAMTSLLSGVLPETHGILTDSAHVPRPKARLHPLPAVLWKAGYPSFAFMRALPRLYRGTARVIAKGLGFSEAHFVGATAEEVVVSASATMRTQQRGLIVLHWADADQAGESHGWMSPQYADACRQLDAALGLLVELTALTSDPHTLLVAFADHGGGGVTVNDHSEEHPLNWTIPLVVAGGSVRRMTLESAQLIDIPATVAWALGVNVPAAYAGRVLAEAIEIRGLTPGVREAAAVA